MDFLAVDRLCAKLMGLSDTAILTQPKPPVTHSYTDPRYLVWMSNAGLGNYDLSKINFINGSLAGLANYIQSYILSTNYSSSPYYETGWSSDTTLGPQSVLDRATARNSAEYANPNPFMMPQPEIVTGNLVTIYLSLPASYSSVNLNILNLEGKVIQNIHTGGLSNGRYSYNWDCTSVPNGDYIISFQFGSRAMNDHVTLAR